jgi:MFS transporter, DHA3 family, tetracycline resistance protein
LLRRTLDSGTAAHGDAARRDPQLVTVFLRWIWWRAVLHRGWWLVTSVYLVVDAGLSPSQLVLVGVAQGAVALLFEVPAGVVADAISRKWSLVVSQVLMGSAMVATGLVTDFPLLVATQMLWGIAWTFASGADVAWITDELDRPAFVSIVLMRSGRAQLTGSAAGIVALGALGSLTQRSTAMVVAGAGMLLLGPYVGARFRERRFAPAPARRAAASWAILVRGSRLVRRSRPLLLMFAATLLVNGGAAAGRLFQRRLVDVGLPVDPVVWFTGLGVVTLLAGAAALRLAERRVEEASAALRGYVLACAAGAAGAVLLAAAPEELSGSAAILLVAGIAVPLTRTLGTIWVNRQTSSDVRATVHSLLAQAEYLGAIACGLGVAAVAGVNGMSVALLACGALFAFTAVLVECLVASTPESRKVRDFV